MINKEGSDFTDINKVLLSGRVVSKHYDTKGMELVVTISVRDRRGKKKRDVYGLSQKKLVKVRFFHILAIRYNEKFEKGDFVIISGVAQNVRNDRNRTSKTEIWGYEMDYCLKNATDKNRVHIRGKIKSSNVISENYILLNVVTKTEEKCDNPSDNMEIDEFEYNYRSVTAVGIRCSKDAKEVIKSYTPGTWCDCKGFVDARTIDINSHKKREMRIIATKAKVVGQVQRIRVVL